MAANSALKTTAYAGNSSISLTKLFLLVIADLGCRDTITPNQDFVVCPHPHCRNLFIATGGSFHAWKFLPIIGKYVVQMLDGSLDPDISSKWAWDRIDKGAAHEHLAPHREMRDVM
jgi:sarcosine oxidase/L-pipecolate oxidase